MQEPITNKYNGIVRVIIYARISDKKQLDGESLETQVMKCTEYALSQNWIIVKVFKELHTGTEYRERKLLSEARETIRNGEADVIIVNSLDRLSREMIHQAVLIDEIKHYNASLVSVTEDIDNSPLGHFMRQALGFAAAVEREKFLERSKRTIDKRIQEGKLIGNGLAAYGYSYNEDHSKYLINPVEASVVERIYTMRLNGIACKRIAIILAEEGIPGPRGQWAITTVFNILKKPIYYGKAQVRKVKHIRKDGKDVVIKTENPIDLPEGTIPPIISKEIFDAVQVVLANAQNESTRNNKNSTDALLRAGFIKCGYCGHNLQAMGKNRENFDRRRQMAYIRKSYYMCNRSRILPKTCTGASITADVIDNIVWKYVGTLLEDLSSIEEALELLKDKQEQEYDVPAIERSIESNKREVTKLAKDIRGLEGYGRDVLVNEMRELEETIRKLEHEKIQAYPNAERLAQQKIEIDKFLQWAEDMKGRYNEATYNEKRDALRILGITVTIYKEKDKEHPRYEIKVGLNQLYSDIPRSGESRG